MLLDIVRQEVDKAINTKLENQESLRKLCVNHERKNIFINKVMHEVNAVSKSKKLNRNNIQDIAESFAGFFCEAVKAHADQKLMTGGEIDAHNARLRKKEEEEMLWNELVIDNSYIETLTADGKVHKERV